MARLLCPRIAEVLLSATHLAVLGGCMRGELRWMGELQGWRECCCPFELRALFSKGALFIQGCFMRDEKPTTKPVLPATTAEVMFIIIVVATDGDDNNE